MSIPKKELPRGIKTVITSLDSKDTVIRHFAYVSSVGQATALVNQLFSDYEDFVYYVDHEKEICEVLFYKSRSAGYWKTFEENIYDYRLDGSNKIA